MQSSAVATVLLDHLVYGALKLGDAVDELEHRLGVRAGGGGQHIGLGTHNALLGLGSGSYVEVITPDPEQPAPVYARPFGLDSLVRPRLVGWALRCDDIDARVARARERGYDPGDPVAVQRTTAAGGLLVWRLTLNALEGGLIPFLIDWGQAVHPSTSAPGGLTLVSMHLEHPAPETIEHTLAALEANVSVMPGSAAALVASVEGPQGRVELR